MFTVAVVFAVFAVVVVVVVVVVAVVIAVVDVVVVFVVITDGAVNEVGSDLGQSVPSEASGILLLTFAISGAVSSAVFAATPAVIILSVSVSVVWFVFAVVAVGVVIVKKHTGNEFTVEDNEDGDDGGGNDDVDKFPS